MKRLTRPRLLLAALVASSAWSAAPAGAGPVFSDPYASGGGDVLGSEADFDIRSLEIQELVPNRMQINVNVNYHGGDPTLAAFSVPGSSFAAMSVGIGDVLIRGQSYLWAIPLSGMAGGPGGVYYLAAEPGGPVAVGTPATRATPLPGSLYRVDSFLTAGQVLGVDPAADFRADEPVWGAIAQFNPDFVGYVPVAFPVGGSELAIHLQVSIGPLFYDDVSNGFDVRFASTTCACDVLSARVPEPAPFALALAAVAVTLARARLCFPRRGGSRERQLS